MIKDSGFQNIQILNEKTYSAENYFQDNKRKILNIIKVVTK